MLFEKSKRPAEQRCCAKQHGRSDRENAGMRRGGRSGAVRALLLQLFGVAVVVMSRRGPVIGTGNDRHRAMIERRHESGRTQQAQGKSDRKERPKHRADCQGFRLHGCHERPLADWIAFATLTSEC